MKINNSNNMNNIKYINSYKTNNQKLNKENKIANNDKCEFSSLGKALNNIKAEENELGIKTDKDIEVLKNQIAQGKYKVDSKVLADKLMDAMKGRI